MRQILEEVPLEALLVGPLPPLTELTSHKQQLFTGLSVHVAEKQTQVGELLPVITRHLAQQ